MSFDTMGNYDGMFGGSICLYCPRDCASRLNILAFIVESVGIVGSYTLIEKK